MNMKTVIGILCIVVPVVAACWDLILPSVKKIVKPIKHKTA